MRSSCLLPYRVLLASVGVIVSLPQLLCIFFFFQAEDGIRDIGVTGVQTCALPIFYDGDGHRVSKVGSKLYWYGSGGDILAETDASGNTTAEYIFFGGKRIAMLPAAKIGRASCRERV